MSEAGSALSDAHSLVGPALDGIAFEVRTAMRSAQAALGDMSNGDVDPFPLSTLADVRVELRDTCD